MLRNAMTPLFSRSTLGASTTSYERMHSEEQRRLMGNDTTYLLREAELEMRPITNRSRVRMRRKKVANRRGQPLMRF